MIQFPLVWLVTLLATIAALTLSQNASVPAKARWFLCGFLASLAILAGLVGARLAGWLDWSLRLQPVTAVMIAPLAFLGFKALTRDGVLPQKRLILSYGLPILLVQMAFLTPFPVPIDMIILAINGLFMVRLSFLLRLPADDFPYTPPHGLAVLKGAMLGTVALFILMISADILIFLAVFTGGNGPAMQFVSGASGFMTMFVLVAALIGTPMLMKNSQAPRKDVLKRGEPSEADRALLKRLAAILEEHQLYRDSNMTLARLARRVGVPSREISGAINRATGENFSRYINQYRIARAKFLLVETDLPITEIMFEAGFVSKSSFNTEFRRMTGQTPSAFRTAEKP